MSLDVGYGRTSLERVWNSDQFPSLQAHPKTSHVLVTGILQRSRKGSRRSCVSTNGSVHVLCRRVDFRHIPQHLAPSKSSPEYRCKNAIGSASIDTGDWRRATWRAESDAVFFQSHPRRPSNHMPCKQGRKVEVAMMSITSVWHCMGEFQE